MIPPGARIVHGEETIDAAGGKNPPVLIARHGASLVIEEAGRRIRGAALVLPDRILVSHEGRQFTFAVRRDAAAPRGRRGDGGGFSREVASPMTGTVIEVLCKAGDVLAKGAPLLVVSAMKMEHRITARGAARVASVRVKAGDLVDIGQLLVELEPVAEPA